MTSMTSLIFSAFLLLLPLAARAQSGNAAAAPASASKVAVISIQNAIMATNEGRKEFEALDKKFEPQKNELKTLSDAIDQLKKQLDTQGSMMNDEARASLAKQIEGKQRILSREQEDAQADFGGQENEVVQKVLRKLLPIIDKYARDNGLSLVVDGSKSWPDWPVLWASPSIDITKSVAEIYNAQSASPTETGRQAAPESKSSTSPPKTQSPGPAR